MSDRSPGRNRRIQEQTGAHDSSITYQEPIEISSSYSVEETPNLSESRNNETDEGELTSCKRVKPCPTDRRRQQQEASRSEEHVMFIHPKAIASRSVSLTLDSLPPTALPNEDSHGNNIFLGHFLRAKDWLFRGRNSHPTNSIRNPDVPHDTEAVLIIRPGDEMMSRRHGHVGQFQPTNSLKNDDKKASTPARPPKKRVFDFSQDSQEPVVLVQTPLSSKKQKTGPAKYLRRNSSNGLNDIRELGDTYPSSSGSGTIKTAQSLGSRPAQAARSTLGEVHEYRGVEAIVGFTKRFRKGAMEEKTRKERSAYTQNASFQKPPLFSRLGVSAQRIGDQDPINLEGDDDEIQESSPSPVAYKGTANLGLSRSKLSEVRPSERKDLKGPTTSRHFQGNKFSLAPGGARVASEISSRPSRRASSSAVRKVDSKPLDLDYDEEDSVDQLAEGHNTGTIPRRVARQGSSSDGEAANLTRLSESVSTHGDIHPSNFKPPSEQSRKQKAGRNSEYTYSVFYVQAGNYVWSRENNKGEGCQQCELRLNEQDKLFEPFFNGESASRGTPSLILKASAIQAIWCHAESSKVQILRSGESNYSPKIQLQIEGPTSGNFVQKLLSMNSQIKIFDTEIERLDNIFKKQAEIAAAHSSRREEVEFLEEKKRRKRENSQGNPKVESANPASRGKSLQQVLESNTGRRRSFEIIAPSRPSQSMTSRMKPRESSTLHNLDLVSQDDVSFPDASQSRAGQRAATRSSARNQHQVPEDEPPELPRWTQQNPGWRKKLGWDSSLVYPPDAKKKSTVDIEDIPRLDEGQFLNDNLIQFYLRYLEYNLEKSNPEIARRIYFQNTFFYEALTKGKIRNGNINYDAVKRWTSKVDLFEYDYIIVPVNESFHWYLAIIYNAAKLIQPDVQEIPDSQEAGLGTGGDSNRHGDYKEQTHKIDENVRLSHKGTSGSPDSMSRKVAQEVEHMSLEDEDEDAQWPEADPISKHKAHPSTGEAKLDPPEPVKEVPTNVDKPKGLSKGRKLKPRRSLPRFDINEPKIITLDSLGNAHSATCVRLREYLVCEARERLMLNISPPSQLGMTAKNIPEQTNHCDCGIYVLGYIEKFLENPDEFVRLILHREMNVKEDWSGMEASTMRQNIRDLVFRLHIEQMQRETEHRSAKKAAKSAKMAKGFSHASTGDTPTSSHTSSTPASPSHARPSASEPDHFDGLDSQNKNGTIHENGPSDPPNGILSRNTDRAPAGVGRDENVSEFLFDEEDSDIAEIPASTAQAAVKKREIRIASEDLNEDSRNPFKSRAKKSMGVEVDVNMSLKRTGASSSAPVEIEESFDGLSQPQETAEEDISRQGEDFVDIMADIDADELASMKQASGRQPRSSRSRTPASTSPTMATRSSPRSSRKKPYAP